MGARSLDGRLGVAGPATLRCGYTSCRAGFGRDTQYPDGCRLGGVKPDWQMEGHRWRAIVLVRSGARLCHWMSSAQHCANPYCAKVNSSGNASACKTGLIFKDMETPQPIGPHPAISLPTHPLQLEGGRSGEPRRGLHRRPKNAMPIWGGGLGEGECLQSNLQLLDLI